jgi:hypothetical protein
MRFSLGSSYLHWRLWTSIAPGSVNAAKAYMAGGRIDRFRVARSRAIAAAVIRRAQMRAAFDDLAGNFDLRLPRVVALPLLSAARILRNATGLRRFAFVFCRPPIGGPFPDIADYVVEPVAVRRERHDGRCAPAAVGREIQMRKDSLPGIGHRLAARHELVTPGEFGVIAPTARCELPFGFGRQFLAGPSRISFGVAVSDVHDRMIVEAADGAARPVGLLPVGAELEER